MAIAVCGGAAYPTIGVCTAAEALPEGISLVGGSGK